MRRLNLLFLLIFVVPALICGCNKKSNGGGEATYRTVQVEISRGNSGTNAAGDALYDFLEAGSVGYSTDAGDLSTASVSREGPSMMSGSFKVNDKATSLWCYSQGSGQSFSVPASISGADADGSFAGMVFCTNTIALGQKSSVTGSIKPVTSAVVLDIYDSSRLLAGRRFTSVTITADDGTALAGDFTLNLRESRIGELKNASSSVSINCDAFEAGADIDNAVSVGAVVLPCSFTGTVTVSGEDISATVTIGQAQSLQAGYVHHIQVDLARASYEGHAPKGFPKKLGVIGDSISTFEGIIPSDHRKYYPTSGCDVDTWQKTYWGQLISKYWNCELDVNTSWSGSSVADGKDGSVRTPFVDHSRLDLFKNPDTIILFGGTNDAISSNGIGLGEFSYDVALDQMTTYKRFRDAYIYVIRYLQTKFPDVQIICIIGTDITGEYGNSVKTIAEHYNLPCVDFRGEKVAGKVTIYSGSHPDAAGHAYKAKKIYDETLYLFQ